MSFLAHEEVNPAATLHHALLRGDERVGGLAGWTLPQADFLATAVREAAERALPRAALADAILDRLRELDAPQPSLDAAERLRAPGTVAVVAGQQPVLLGGPHLVFSKALHAVALARRIEAESGAAAVPIFWSAAEDHDHGEADHVSVLSGDGEVERLRLELPHDRRMLAAVPVPSQAPELLERLTALLPDAPGRAWVLDAIGPHAGDTMGDWFARIVLRLLGPLGVVVVEPQTLRPYARPVLRSELQRPGALASALDDELKRLEGSGFEPPLRLSRPELFFAVREGRRLICRRDAQLWRIADDEARTTDELLADVEGRPETFSWNVVARVLAQNTALPVAAQVCGPSEFGYAAAIAPLHRRIGVPAPHLVSRSGVSWVEPRVARALVGLGHDANRVVTDGASALEAPVTELPELAGELVALVERLPVGISGAERKRRAALVRAAELYASAVRKALAERDEVGGRRRALALAALRPGGHLQERVLSALPWLAREGPELLTRWTDALAGAETGHHVLPVAAGG